MANKGNSDAELPSDPSSSSLSSKETTEENDETIQEQSSHRNDHQSNPDPDTTVKSENSSEPEDKQEETGKPSSHGNDPQSNPDPDTTVKSDNGSEPAEQQEEETIQEQSSLENDAQSNPDPDTTVKSENSSEPKDKQEEEKIQEQSSHENDHQSNPDPDTTVKKETIQEQSSHKNDPQPNPDPDTTVKSENSSEPGDKQEEETGKQPTHRNDAQPNPDPDTTVKSENIIEPEDRQEGVGPSGDSSPKEDNKTPKEEDDNKIVATSVTKRTKARDINDIRDKNEDPDQDKKLKQEPGVPQREQPQIVVPDSIKSLIVVVIVAAVVWLILNPRNVDSTPPVPKEFNVVDVFNQEMKKLESSFPNQRPELWRRSLIHLRRHLKTENPSEPVSLILTSGHRAEKTLDCLARCLARAFSTALNSSVLNINGKDKASQDSDQVKLDIDSELRKAFEGKNYAAVIHRFEELPPGSTLIFYRYCDHENAAYKNVFLAFTVMLDAEVPSNVSLGRVEEMVQEHIKQKFVSSDKSAMFNQMDVDKLSGLWSRISHLILPVVAVEKIEQQGCGECNK